MSLTIETILTSPGAFSVPASALQRAVCRMLDGLPLGDLAGHPDVISAFGGPEAVASLPVGAPPPEVVVCAPIRSCKSILSICVAIRSSQCVDVSGLVPGEVPRFTLMSLRLDNSQAAFGMLAGVMQKPALHPLLIDEPTADSLLIRHPSGRPMEIACVAGARAGAGLVSRWSFGVAFDEAPRMVGSEDGVVNLDDARSAVMGRLLPGAQILYIGSPWAPFGPVYDMVQEHWGKS
ncbi:MAG TPA: hypothetical protein VKP30_30640 [Polyangiaceae bacterium]|nr:hypothetical protein [Polyangiaceae bacterium]